MLATGKGSQCSNPKCCSAHPHVVDKGNLLDEELASYDTECWITCLESAILPCRLKTSFADLEKE